MKKTSSGQADPRVFSAKKYPTPREQTLILPLISCLLILLGWYMVGYQAKILIEVTTLTYQQTQLEITRAVARGIESYGTEQVKEHGRLEVATFEQEIFKQFVAPVRLLNQGDAWIYAPDHIVIDQSSDFPPAYRGKSIVEIFDLQAQQGASHYQEITEAVLKAQEGTGWYIWLPQQGREIAAWTPVRVGELGWVVGLSIPLQEILEASGVQTKIRNSYILMGVVSLTVLIMLIVWDRGQRQRDKAETEREQSLMVEQEQRLLAESLSQALLTLTSQTDQTKVLDEILNQVQQIVPYDNANIVLIENKVMHFVRWQGYQPAEQESLDAYRQQPLTGFPLDAEVVQSRQAVVIGDVNLDSRWIPTPTSTWVRSFLSLPILLHEQVIGLLRLNSYTPYQFSAQAITRLQPLTHAAAIALENARLYDHLQKELVERTESQQRALDLSLRIFAVQYIGAVIASSLDLDYILNTITAEVGHLLDIERCAVYEWQQANRRIVEIACYEFNRYKAAADLPESYYLADYPWLDTLIVKKQSRQMTLSQPQVGPAEKAFMQIHQRKTLLMFSMEAQGQIIGLLEISDTRREQTFAIDDMALIQQLANQTAIALRNALLYNQATQEIAERRKLENELRESETKFRTLAETTAAAIFIFQQNRNRYVNPTAVAITGYSQAELLAMDFWEIVHPDFSELVKNRGHSRLRGESVPTRYELKILTKNKQERWLEVNLGVVNFEGQSGVLGTAFDVTDRKEASEALQKSEANLKAIFENSQQAFILLDKDYRILAFNKTANEGIQHIIGQALQPGSCVDEYTAFEELAQFKENLALALQGQSVSQEKMFSLGGSETWMEFNFNPVFADNGQIIGVCFSTVDITLRKKLIETLAENEQRLLAEFLTVLAITRALVTEIDLSRLLEFIMVQAKHLTQANGVAVSFLSDNRQQLEVAVLGQNHHQLEINPLDESRLHIQSNLQLPLAGSPVEQALGTRSIQVSHPAKTGWWKTGLSAGPNQKQPQTLVCAPLTIQHKDLGALLIWFDQAQVFTQHDIHMMTLFADQAALALNNAYLYAINRQLAVTQERHRLARDLHDSVTQTLYSIGLGAETALELLNRKRSQDIHEPLTHIRQLSQIALREIREQVHQLYPATFAVKTLPELLEAHCTLLRQQHGLMVNLVLDPTIKFSIYQRENVFYLAKEALWNVVKHAQGAQVRLSLTRTDQTATLSIADNGPGFVTAAAGETGLYGLRGMRERAALLNATFALDSHPDRGTRITVQIPLP